jgi:hypothetical protein
MTGIIQNVSLRIFTFLWQMSVAVAFGLALRALPEGCSATAVPGVVDTAQVYQYQQNATNPSRLSGAAKTLTTEIVSTAVATNFPPHGNRGQSERKILHFSSLCGGKAVNSS